MNNLWKYAKKYWFLYILAISSTIISVLLDAMAPQITKHIIDDVIVDGQMQILMKLLLGLIGIGFGRAIFQYTKEFIFDYASAGICCRLRRDLFDHIQTLSMGYFDRHNTGELMARIKDDTERIWNAFGFVGMLVLECTIHTIIVLVCMFRLSPSLTLIPVLIMPIIAWYAIKLENSLGKVYDEISEQTAELNTVAQENLAGVRTVKAFAREKHEIAKFNKHNKKYYDLNMSQANLIVRYQPNISFLSKILVMAVIVIGGILVINKKMSLGDLGAFSEYANNIIWPMEMVGWLSNDIAAAVASNKKIKKVMEEQPVITSPAKPVNPDKIRGELTFRNVDFELSDKQILKNIDFTLKEGKTLGIMGMTGSGKSSVVNLIERFYDVSSGEITIDGINIKELSLPLLRSQISVVSQEVFLFSDSISDNIKTGNKDATEWESVQQASISASAHGFIKRLSEEYETVIGERGVGLSGGQKQRISIARAIAKETPILILDDSTSALDMETEKEIEARLTKQVNSSKIIIAHRISAVRSADEILVLSEGQIMERGTHEELMKMRGQYYKTYQVQYGEEETICQ
ncbi:ABC transporter ATP-binding protein [Clostridium sp. E02]|uniref:ABC transporter ATP-binding protein n=1 Tax=Clostridium sp. E02 TaxID=2487134 RepID=UPI000F54BADB|nr:ABC transporter ATP-binding protein [Clostridium sp. E02]